MHDRTPSNQTAYVEPLEERKLFAAVLDGALLSIAGTRHADQVAVYMDANDAAKLVVNLNGNVQSFDRSNIAGINVKLGKGNDQITFDESNGAIDLPATIRGDAGNDSIIAGSGNDLLRGGDGRDTIHGGAGNDILQGGKGADQLFGDHGDDDLDGGKSADQLTGGDGVDHFARGTGGVDTEIDKTDGDLAYTPLSTSKLPRRFRTMFRTLFPHAMTLGCRVNDDQTFSIDYRRDSATSRAQFTFVGAKPFANLDSIRLMTDEAAAAFVSANAGPAPALPGNWHIAFAEEFNTMPDPNLWTSSLWGMTKWTEEAQNYNSSAVSVNNGILNLTATKQSQNGKPYVSGLISTGGNGDAAYAFKYGYVEARMKLPAGKGLWPAFWMLPDANGGNYHDGDGEIDIMEVLGDAIGTHEAHLHVHGKTYGKAYDTGVDLSKDFHVYGLDWQADHLTFYFDGKEILRVTDTASIPNVPEYLILNLAVGGEGSWPGVPNAATQFPATMEVDYVHVWQKAA